MKALVGQLHELEHMLRSRQSEPAAPDTSDFAWPPAPLETHYAIEAVEGRLVARVAIECSRCAEGQVSRRGADGMSYVGRCRCYPWRIGAARFSRSVLPEGALHQHGDSLDGSRVKGWPDIVRLLRLAAEGARGALLTGSTGSGKSHMAAAVIRRATLVHGLSARWARWPDVLGACRAAIAAHGEPEAVLDSLTRSRVLVLDELGGERSTEWTTDALTRVLSAAIDRGCTVVATSNHTALELGRIIGERSSSRLAQLCPEVVVRAPDYRRSVK